MQWRRWTRCLLAGLAAGLLLQGAPAHGADEPGFALAVVREARALAARGELEAALEKTERALAFARAEYGDHDALVGFILDDLATLNYRLRRLDEALARAEQALPVIRAARGPGSIGHALVASNLATILTARGRAEEALPLYRDALPILERELGRAHPRTATLATNLGAVRLVDGDLAGARSAYDVALDGWRRIEGPDGANAVRTALARAEVLLRQGESDAARADAEAVREALVRRGDPPPRDLAAADLILADAELRDFEPLVARERLRGTRERLEGDPAATAELTRVLDRLGTLDLLAGDHLEAERALARVLEAERKRLGPDDPALADIHRRLGVAHWRLGRLDDAEADLRAALRLERDAQAGAAIRTLLAQVLIQADRADQAALLFMPAEPREPRENDRLTRLETLPVDDLEALGAVAPPGLRRALTDHLRDVATSDGASCPGRARALAGLAAAGLDAGEFAAAARDLEAAVALGDEHPFCAPGTALLTRLRLADVRLADGRAEEALDRVREARVRIARTRTSILDRENMERALDLVAAATAGSPDASDLALMIDVAQLAHLEEQRSLRGAFRRAAAEGGRAGADLVREHLALEQQLRARERMLDGVILVDGVAVERRPANEAALDLNIRKLDRLERTIRREFEDLARWVLPEPLDLALIQSALGPREALLIQVTGERTTHLFLVRSGSVAHAETELGAATLEDWVGAAGAQMRAEGRAFDSFALHALHVGLISPFDAALAEIDHLLVMPDRAMRRLPIGLLVAQPAEPVPPGAPFDRLEFLIERVAISVVPDPAVLVPASGGSSATLPFIGLAAAAASDDPVPDASREARLRAIGEALAPDGAPLLDLQATEAGIAAFDLEQFRTVAVAMPAARTPDGGAALAFDGRAPVADDGALLTVEEIAGLELDADLAVLVAEAPPAPAPPELDLATAFAFAGARAVVIGHWAAPPAAMRDLVGEAAAALQQDPGLEAAEALRKTILPRIGPGSDAAAGHPRSWGAFTVVDGAR